LIFRNLLADYFPGKLRNDIEASGKDHLSDYWIETINGLPDEVNIDGSR
jgi:hypothetical protein